MAQMLPYLNTGLNLGAALGMGLGPVISPGLGLGGTGGVPSTGDPEIDGMAQQYADLLRQQTLMGYQTAMSNIETAMQQLYMQELGVKAKAAEDDANQAKNLAGGVQL